MPTTTVVAITLSLLVLISLILAAGILTRRWLRKYRAQRVERKRAVAEGTSVPVSISLPVLLQPGGQGGAGSGGGGAPPAYYRREPDPAPVSDSVPETMTGKGTDMGTGNTKGGRDSWEVELDEIDMLKATAGGKGAGG